MLDDAKQLEEAGADLLVVECIPSSLGESLAKNLAIPVIGIGAGPATDAQVLVLQDMLGISAKPPKFAKNFLIKESNIQNALKSYRQEVHSGAFPGAEHSF
jgi:3-methyl-2-oxobutanoate hydroxymethyltransferase